MIKKLYGKNNSGKSKKASKLYVNIGSKAILMAESGVELVSFTNGTDEQIGAMLDAYYSGKLSWEDMGWSVGDTRLIHLNAMQAPNPNSSNTWAAQDITVVIVDHDHTPLATPINGHANACITVQTRECMNNNSAAYNEAGHIYVNGDSSYDMSFTKWSNLYMRTYMNSTVLAAFSYSTGKGSGTSFKDLIKSTTHYRHTNYNTANSELITDTLFLPSCPEIFGTTEFYAYVATSPVEGTQFSYYTTFANRIKYGNNNGASNNVKQYWWPGSTSSNYSSSYGYRWCYVGNDGNVGDYYGSEAYGLAPAFAM